MNHWTAENQSLKKTFTFLTFEEAMRFMQLATPLISQLDHHPTWSNTYNRVHVILTTHDVGNVVTEKDRELARILDEVYANLSTAD
jgi:4a-hydroxytetrahydrobiopterin dehydratase